MNQACGTDQPVVTFVTLESSFCSNLKTRRRLSLTWDWVLDTMVGHVKALVLPDVPECLSSSEERLVLDSDPDMVTLLDTVHVFVEFLSPLQEQALHG